MDLFLKRTSRTETDISIFYLLANLSKDIITYRQQILKIWDLLGIEFIVNIMKSHSDVLKVQQEGCFIISRFLYSDNIKESERPDKERILGRFNEVIVTAMKSYSNDVYIQYHGISALKRIYYLSYIYYIGFSKLLLGRRCNRNINISREIEFIINAMKLHPEEVDIQREGCYALYYISCYGFTKITLISDYYQIPLKSRSMILEELR